MNLLHFYIAATPYVVVAAAAFISWVVYTAATEA